jgi:Cd2+/Zn2+-exporting ATPase
LALRIAMTTTRTFVIRGMDCANEVRLIRAAVDPLPGVRSLEVDLLRGHARVAFDEQETSALAIQQAIRRAGFASEIEGGDSRVAHDDHRRRLQWMLFAGVCTGAGTGLALSGGASGPWQAYPWMSQCLLVLGAGLSARFYVPRAFATLRQRHADMNVLVLVATVGAFLLGEWVEGAAVSFLFAVANLLETWSALRVRKSIEAYLDLAPQTAERIHEPTGEITLVPADAVRAGDLLLVRPGARLPADGTVVQGCSHVHQAALTGEAIPLFAEPGAQVLAGSTNGETTLRIRAATDGANSLASRVKEAIVRAQSLRSQTERWIERFSRRYTPLVLASAIVLAVAPPLFGLDAREWFYNALVLVLIACPCALVISTPVTMVSAISALARGGVLLRGGESVERAAAVRAIAFDKTGVLTTGHLRVQEIRAFGRADVETALRAAAALERLSEHPVARAVVAAAEERGVAPGHASEYRALPGKGGEGLVDGTPVWVGNQRLAEERGVRTDELAEEFASEGQENSTLVWLGSGPQLWLVMSLADQPRPGAANALASLRQMGYHGLTMLTGDRHSSAAGVARAVGLSAFRAGLLPDEKLNALRELDQRDGPAAMVGDGLNDAPAMASASFSIASGDRAANATLEAADAVIWNGELRKLPWLFATCRRAMKIVRQNVALAIGSKLVFALLAALGIATLWMAVLADVGATLLVTFNGLRMVASAQEPARETSDALEPVNTSS